MVFGEQIEREIANGAIDSYHFSLQSGQYFRIAINNKGAVLRIRIRTSDGVILIDLLAPNSKQDPLHLSSIVKDSGKYIAEISAVNNVTARIPYAISLDDVHSATAEDRDRVQAETSTAEAFSLVAKGGSNALVAAIDKYREALVVWRRLNNRREEALTLLSLGSVTHNLSRSSEALDYYRPGSSNLARVGRSR